MIVTVFRYSGGKLLRQLVSKKFCTQRKVITICNFLMYYVVCVLLLTHAPTSVFLAPASSSNHVLAIFSLWNLASVAAVTGPILGTSVIAMIPAPVFFRNIASCFAEVCDFSWWDSCSMASPPRVLFGTHGSSCATSRRAQTIGWRRF